MVTYQTVLGFDTNDKVKFKIPCTTGCSIEGGFKSVKLAFPALKRIKIRTYCQEDRCPFYLTKEPDGVATLFFKGLRNPPVGIK